MATTGDVVLVYLEDQPVFFARVEDILPDHKKDWYHIKLLVLQVPMQTVTWILRDAYINGSEFTMGGKRMRLEKVEAPAEDQPQDQPHDPPGEQKDPNAREDRESPESGDSESGEKTGPGRVISFPPRKPEK